MADYEKIGEKALAALVRNGRKITLYRESGGSTNPVTGAVSAGVDVSVSSSGINLSYPDSMIDGSRVIKGDRRLLLSNENVPLPSDKPILDGEKWSIVDIDKTSPAGTAVIYKVQVRR